MNADQIIGNDCVIIDSKHVHTVRAKRYLMKIKILSKKNSDIYEELELVKAFIPFVREIILYTPNTEIYQGIIESDFVEGLELEEWKFLLTEAIPFELYIKPYELYEEDQMTMSYTGTSFIVIPESELMFSNAKVTCPTIKNLSLRSALELREMFSDPAMLLHQEDSIESIVERIITFEKLLLEAKVKFNDKLSLHVNPTGEFDFSYKD